MERPYDIFLVSSTVAVSMVVSEPVYDIVKLDWKLCGLMNGEEASGDEVQNEEPLEGPYRNVLWLSVD